MPQTSGARHHSAWFAFAGRAFLSTDPKELLRLIGELRNVAFPQTASERLLAEMERALRGQDEDLEKEYVRLFLNPAGAPCPPWQSAHADEPQLMGPAHRSALAWYRAAGVEPKVTTEPADHVGLLLAFYANLLESGNGPEILRAFYEEHLAWIPPYCELIIAETHHAFYRSLAEATRNLVLQAGPRS